MLTIAIVDSGIGCDFPDAAGEPNTFQGAGHREAVMESDEQGTQFHYQYSIREGRVTISLEGFEVLKVEFDSENLGRGLFESVTRSKPFLYLSEERRRRVYEALKEVTAERELAFDDERAGTLENKLVRDVESYVIKKSIEAAKNKVSENFTDSVVAFWERLLNLASFAGANALRDLINTPEEKYSAKFIETTLRQLDRERLRALIGEPITRGGARNVKHLWTDEERAQLAAKYEEFQPVWIEAKRIARAAQKSRERTRKQEWRAEVLRAYPNLPHDLLERYSNPKADDAKPADLAVIHAKRECGITEEYSPRHLRDQIKAWRLKIQS